MDEVLAYIDERIALHKKRQQVEACTALGVLRGNLAAGLHLADENFVPPADCAHHIESPIGGGEYGPPGFQCANSACLRVRPA